MTETSDDAPEPRWKNRLWKAVIATSVIAALATAYFMYSGWQEHKRVQKAVDGMAVVIDDLERCIRGSIGPVDELAKRIRVEEQAGVVTRAKVAGCREQALKSMQRFASLRERHDELKEFWAAIDDLPIAGTDSIAIPVCAALDRARAEVDKLHRDPHDDANCKLSE